MVTSCVHRQPDLRLHGASTGSLHPALTPCDPYALYTGSLWAFLSTPWLSALCWSPPPKKIGPRFQFTLYIFLWLWMVGRQPNFFEMQAFWNHFLQCRLPPAGLPYHELSPSHESESPPLLSLSRKQRAAGADAQAESTIQVDRARLPGVGRTVTREP